ncbi:MAG TPA: PEGA domain-containing protein [Povalibacter sp.]|nr:PEGA domain-containing protein [Povalibacter sp.]
MSVMRSIRLALAMGVVGAGFVAGGCASIVHGGNRSISIASQPPGAKASIRKTNGGEVVSVNQTPCTVSLDPKGGYFKGQSYTLKLELPGYETTEVQLKPSLSGWYFGNVLIGGLIGMLAVDPATGAMWNIEPEKIDQNLSSSQAVLIRNKSGFVVVLVSDLTPAEREKMTRLN